MVKERSLSSKIERETKTAKNNFAYFHSLCEKETATGGVTIITHGKRCDAIGRLEILEIIDKEFKDAVKRLKKLIQKKEMKAYKHSEKCLACMNHNYCRLHMNWVRDIEEIVVELEEIFGPKLTETAVKNTCKNLEEEE